MSTVAMAVLVVIVPGPMANAVSCGPFQVNFAGYKSLESGEPHEYEGVSANLRYRTGYLCLTIPGTANNLSTTWTMVISNDKTGYAQSGYLRNGIEGCWHHFAEQKKNASSSFRRKNGSCANPGEVHHVWQQSVYVGGSLGWSIRSNIDLTIFLRSDTDPSGGWNQFAQWVEPFVVEFLGETHYHESDVPGTSAEKSEWTDMGVQDFYDNQWYSSCNEYVNLVPITDSNPQRYSTDMPACSHVRAWTSG